MQPFKKSANPDENGWYDINWDFPIPRNTKLLVRIKAGGYHVASLNQDGEWINTHGRLRYVTHWKPIVGPVV